MSAAHDTEEMALGPVTLARLGDLRRVGALTQVDANARDCSLISTSHGASHGKDHIDLSVLVAADGRIADAKYRSLASGLDLVAFDIMAELAIGCAADDLAAIDGAACVRWLQEQGEKAEHIPEALAGQKFPVLTKVAVAMRGGNAADDAAAAQTADAPMSKASELPWEEIGLFEKVRRVEQVLDDQVRPMLATDGGGIELVDLRDSELVVQYNGACGSCSSSIGGTMMFIEDTLQNALGVEMRLVVQGMDEPEPFMDL
ncbi:MAG: NifU family protein [Planctomycetota bacterium]|nr:MAG: NifU family protein [Planctomycetota bacterium]